MHEGTSFLTSLRAISRELPKAYESAPPWLFIIIPFKPSKLAPLYLLGSTTFLKELSTFIEDIPAIFVKTFFAYSSFSFEDINLAIPSLVFNAILPTKPSQTITSILPQKMSSPSTNPT